MMVIFIILGLFYRFLTVTFFQPIHLRLLITASLISETLLPSSVLSFLIISLVFNKYAAFWPISSSEDQDGSSFLLQPLLASFIIAVLYFFKRLAKLNPD